MVLHVDGFDWCANANTSWKYKTYTSGLILSGGLANGRQPAGSPGGGSSFGITNTGFGGHARSVFLGPRHTWIVGRAMFLHAYGNSSDPRQAWRFLRFESAASNSDSTNNSTQLCIGFDNTGTLVFLVGGAGVGFNGADGTVVSQSTYTLPLGQWVYVEFKIQFGASGRIQVWADDVLVHDDHPLADIGKPGGVLDPDRFSNFWDQVGTVFDYLQYDDQYVADTSGSVNNDHLGPVRVSIASPTIDGIAESWSRNVGGSNASCVDDGPSTGPDGATTEVSAGAGALDLYAMARPACFGRVLALALNACGHGNAAPGSLDLVCRPLRQVALQVDLATGLVLPNVYGELSVVQAISQRFPPDNALWRDGDIGKALWGMRAQAADKVTQVFVEKITSLRAGGFDCGSGSYSY